MLVVLSANVAMASEALEASELAGKNLELSFFWTLERLPKSGPVALLITNHRIVTAVATQMSRRWLFFTLVVSDTELPFSSIDEAILKKPQNPCNCNSKDCM